MELAWWSGESSVSEAAGSLTLGMAWWALWSEEELAAGTATVPGDGRSWEDLAGGADSSGSARLSTQLFLLAA